MVIVGKAKRFHPSPGVTPTNGFFHFLPRQFFVLTPAMFSRTLSCATGALRATQRRGYAAAASGQTAAFAGAKNSKGNYTVTLIPGDGIGPEISEAVKAIYVSAKVPIQWEEVSVTPILQDGKTVIPDAAISSVKKNTVALKGPLATPSDWKGTCLVELDASQDFQQNFANIKYDEDLLDRACLQITTNPAPFADRVMVMPNLYGDILSDMCAGLIGGLGLTPSGNIGKDASIFEAVHGSAPDIAGKGLANPTALLLSSLMMLRHMNLYDHAAKIEAAALGTIAEGKTITGDLGGKATTEEFTEAIINKLK
ncbi:hypothetical protein RSAG8_00887, partial [Rhizoctonia solani AG-8 WAC10335]